MIMVAGQKIALGRTHKHQTVAVLVSDTTLAVEPGDGDVRVIRRTTTQPVRSIKGQRPRMSSGGWRAHSSAFSPWPFATSPPGHVLSVVEST